MILCINNNCNRNCEFCFEGSFKNAPVQMMSVADVHRIATFANLQNVRNPTVSILGGEPTLHPDLVQIIELVRRMNASGEINLLSNLLCDPAILQSISRYGVGGLINVGGFPGYSDREKELLYSNLDYCGRNRIFHGICVAVTITDVDQDFEFLYEMIGRDEALAIGGVRVGISAPGTDFANDFPHEFSLGYGDKYLEIVERCHQIRPLFGFSNECPVNMCMMSEEVYNRLAPVVHGLRKQVCTGNLDIMPDFSTHWCFAFQNVPELRIMNIFDYRDMAEVYRTLCDRATALAKSLGSQCDSSSCTSLYCKGPCPAINYFRKHVKGKPQP